MQMGEYRETTVKNEDRQYLVDYFNIFSVSQATIPAYNLSYLTRQRRNLIYGP